MKRTTLLSAAVLLGATACSGSSGSASGFPTAPVTETQAPTQAPTATPTAPTTPAPVTTTAAPSPTAAAGPPRCLGADLKASIGEADGAAGSSYAPIVLTNTGSATCELIGFPGVSFVTGESGTQVGKAATFTNSKPRKEVDLKTGGSATATLQIVNYQNQPTSSCAPKAVTALRIYPPGSTEALFVPMKTTACSSTTINQLYITNVFG